MNPLPITTLLLVLGTAPVAPAPEEAAARPASPELVSLDAKQRGALLDRLDSAGKAALLQGLEPEHWLQLFRRTVDGLGIYRVTLEKAERVDGEVLPPQTLELLVREKPQAIYVEFVKGPAKGRRILYNSELRKDELRVKEAGILGFAGALWLSLDSGMTRKDSNHPVNMLGFGPMVALLEKEIATARPFGGLRRTSAGFENGLWCSRYEAPPGAKGLYAKWTRICGDPVVGLPSTIEVHDAKGFRERLRFTNVRREKRPPPGAFTLEGHGL